jgi:cell division protein FtsL
MLKESAALLSWLFSSRQASAGVLVITLAISAFFVSFSAHNMRQSYRDLQILQKEEDDLDHEYEKLMLERGAWADYSRITEVADAQLAMRSPSPDELVVLR